jgi:ribosomal protein S27E
MTIDEAVREYMRGWLSGVNNADGENHYPAPSDDYERAYAAGRAAYLVAEQVERERLLTIEPCPRCLGKQVVLDAWNTAAECPVCHATGEKMP